MKLMIKKNDIIFLQQNIRNFVHDDMNKGAWDKKPPLRENAYSRYTN